MSYFPTPPPVLDTVIAAGALTASPTLTTSTAVDVSRYDWVDFMAQLSTPGGPTLNSVDMQVQWSNAAAPGAGDWVYLTREEFQTTGSGIATESQYTARFAVTGGSLPTSVGVHCKCRGNWMRVLVGGDAAVVNVNRTVTSYRRQ